VTVHLVNLALSFCLGGLCALLVAGLASTWPARIRRRDAPEGGPDS
jgi:hypothetical protein